MKLIFTTAGNDLDALLDPSFGRARNFLLYDLDSGTSQVISNQQNLNGFQATRTIKRDAATGHIPVILVTTKDQETDRVWGMRQGAQGYLTKPFSEAELTEAILSTIGHGQETA